MSYFQQMEITITNVDLIKIVHISGELNAVTSSEAETKINQLIMGGNHKLIIDLDKLRYISSAGLRVFLIANKLNKKNPSGEIRICKLNDIVKEVFEISGFNLIFKCFEDSTAAQEGWS